MTKKRNHWPSNGSGSLWPGFVHNKYNTKPLTTVEYQRLAAIWADYASKTQMFKISAQSISATYYRAARRLMGLEPW